MTLPSSSFPGLDAVTVSAPHNALVPRNLFFHGRDGLELGYVRSFPNHVVDVECSSVCVVPTVDAPTLDLEVRDPFFDAASTSVIDAIDSLPIAGLLKSTFTPGSTLFRRRRLSGWPGSTGAKRRAVFCVGPFRRERFPAIHTRPISSWSFFPGRHVSMISAIGFIYPCKPDIFEQGNNQ